MGTEPTALEAVIKLDQQKKAIPRELFEKAELECYLNFPLELFSGKDGDERKYLANNRVWVRILESRFEPGGRYYQKARR